MFDNGTRGDMIYDQIGIVTSGDEETGQYFDLRLNMFHEIGHAFGLQHSSNIRSFMNNNPYHMYDKGIFEEAFMKNQTIKFELEDRLLVHDLFPDDVNRTFATNRNINNLKKYQCLTPGAPVCRCPNGIAGEVCEDGEINCVDCDQGYHIDETGYDEGTESTYARKKYQER